jgi:SAM-dependent methyltransferase
MAALRRAVLPFLFVATTALSSTSLRHRPLARAWALHSRRATVSLVWPFTSNPKWSLIDDPGYAGSRRNLVRGALWTGLYGCGTISCASAYTPDRVKPDEKETYAEAQNSRGPLRVLWVGSGNMTKGVYRDLFQPGNEVVALDLLRPDASDLRVATNYASEHGYRLRFEQGDATHLEFGDGTFDVVVSSMFLCQGSEMDVPLPNWSEDVVSEIRRVLKPGGRFGFYEHVEDIDTVIVDKVFGERSVVRLQHNPERLNVMAGVVRKV